MTSTRHRPSGRSSFLRTAVAAACLVLLLGACELRLQTPAPTAPSPSATEMARQRAATDAVVLAEMATLAAGGARADGTGATVVDTLDEVATTSDRHATALGGVYLPWPASPTPTPTAPTASPEPIPSAGVVVAALRAAAARASDDADTVTDGPLARLLASVAASRTVLADALDARSAGTALALPTSGPTDPPSAAPPPAPVTASAAPGIGGSRGAVPGLQDSSLTALLEAEDALGAGWEVLAARSSGQARSRAALVAAEHRARAQAWATLLGVAGTALDPRRDAYALPLQVLDPAGDALAGLLELETRLGDRLAALIAQVEPGARGPFVRALAANALLVLQAAGTTTAFPGLGETVDTPATSSPSP